MSIISNFPQGGGGSTGGYDLSQAVITLASSSFVYDGTEKTQGISSVTYNGTELTEGTQYIIVAGSNKATNAGTHTLAIAGIWPYTGVGNASWSIGKADVTLPTVSVGTYRYDGSTQGPSIAGFDGTKMSKSGDTASAVGNYTLAIWLTDTVNYQWANSGSDISQTWEIMKGQLTQPTVTVGTYTYDGTSQGPSIGGFDSNTMTKTGDTAIHAGSYTLEISITNTGNYEWASGSDVSEAWSIGKAQGSVSANPASVTVNSAGGTSTSTLTIVGDGNVTVQSGDSSVVTASINGNIVTVTGVAGGNTTVTVTLTDGDDYYGTTCSIAATFSTYDPILANNTPAQIKAAIQDGVAQSLWSVGDLTAPISIGAFADVAAFSMSAFIVEFTTGINASTGKPAYGVLFQFGAVISDGIRTDLCIVGSNYDNDTTTAGVPRLCMNDTATNVGGYDPQATTTAGMVSMVRYMIEMRDAIESDWRDVLAYFSRYCDTVGNADKTDTVFASRIVIGKLIPPSECEILGTTNLGNGYAKQYEHQLTYYANGNSTKKYRHTNISASGFYWSRTPYRANSTQFVVFNAVEGGAGFAANRNRAIAPLFAIGYITNAA